MSELLYSGYVVEKRPIIGKGAKWIKVVTLDQNVHTTCVENLKESEFLFRVFAENSVGLSIPTCSEPVTLKSHASEYLYVIVDMIYHLYKNKKQELFRNEKSTDMYFFLVLFDILQKVEYFYIEELI